MRGSSFAIPGFGKTLGCLIAGVIDEDGEMVFNPDPETKLNTSQTLMIMGEKDNLRKFKETSCREGNGANGS